MKRAEIWWVNFDPSLGGEIRKTRPAIIISNDAANQVMNRVQVVPISSQTQKIYPCEAMITVANKPAKAMADQIMTVSKQRLQEYIGCVMPEEMHMIERAIMIQLAIR